MLIELTCIICPNGCKLSIEHHDNKVVRVENARCNKGRDYASEELTNPVRILTTTVRVTDGEFQLVSVRTDGTIPKSMLLEAVKSLQDFRVKAPVNMGDILIADFMQTGVNIIATGDIAKLSE
jgi:CxxC motif-containing protein